MAFDNLGPSDSFEDDWGGMDFGDSEEGIPNPIPDDDDEIDFGVGEMDSQSIVAPNEDLDTSEIDVDGDFEIGGPTTNGPEQSQDQGRKGIMKTALIAIGIGGALILVAIFIFARLGKGPAKPKSTPTPQVSQQGQQSNTNVMNPSTQTSYDNWVEFKSEYDTEFSTVISSTFTVTNIHNFAKVVNDDNDKIVKSVITGNISGLIGTYEAEVPYDIGRNISVGTTVKCEYSLYAQDGVRIIGGIKFP